MHKQKIDGVLPAGRGPLKNHQAIRRVTFFLLKKTTCQIREDQRIGQAGPLCLELSFASPDPVRHQVRLQSQKKGNEPPKQQKESKTSAAVIPVELC